MSSVKKRGQSPATENSPDTQVARSQQRARDTAEKQVNQRTVTPAVGSTPTPSISAKRPPTGRRRGRKNREVVETVEVIEEVAPPDPFQGAIQQFDNDVGETAGAVMLVTKEDTDEFGAVDNADSPDAVTINDVSTLNPHYIHAMIVGAVAIFFIVVFAIYIDDVAEPLREVRSEIKDVALQVATVIDVLNAEYQAATALLTTTEYYLVRNQGGTQQYLEVTTARIADYRTAMETTNKHVTYASLIFEKYESKLHAPLGGLGFDIALNVATLGQVRDGVIKGAPAASIFGLYDFLFRNLVMFETRLLAVRSVNDASDRTVMARLMSLTEEQNYGLSATFSQWVNLSTSTSSSELRALNSFDELRLPWTFESVVDVDEAMRLPLSWESYPTHESDSTLRDYSGQLNALIMPQASKDLYRQLGEQSYQGQSIFWDPVYGNSLMTSFLPTTLVALQGNDPSTLRSTLDRQVPARRTAQLTSLILLFCLAVLALICHVANSIVYHRNRDEHDAANREIRILQKSLTRMNNFVAKASRLDIAAVASIIRRAQRAKTVVPPEEQQLYASLSALRDVELFMPSTVTHPPVEISKLALNKAQLFLQPALGFTKGTVALRINLSVFHSQFFTAGVKQKALQHQMTRCLTALQELTDEHVSHNGSILNVQGDHAIMWINLLRPSNYPNMCAISIALALSDECQRLSIRTPAMCIACGDALAGHVSSVAPDASHLSSSAMCFTAFGTVTKDFTILETVAKVHDCPLTLNNAAALSFFQERVEFDGEVFHGNATDALAGFASSGFMNSDHTRGEEGNDNVEREDATRSTNRPGAAIPPRERLSLEERLRKLHCHFRPLEMVNASTSRSSEESLAVVEHNFRSARERQAMLRRQRNVNPLGADNDPSVHETDFIELDDGASFRDYSRDLADNSVIFPCFALVPFQPNKQQQEDAGMVQAWNVFFASYVECCHDATAERVSLALMQLSEFTSKFPQAAGPTVERIKKLLLLSKSTGEVSTAVGTLKRARLLETLCA